MPSLSPLRGIAYSAIPCTEPGCSATGKPSEDLQQVAYAKQWGEAGRDDLGTMAGLGANGVRLYHSFGLDEDPKGQGDHGQFLDRAQAVGLNVIPGYHTEGVHRGCPNFDCYDTWKRATLQGFDVGFRKGDRWHPAVSMLVLLNEPDSFVHYPECADNGAWCRVKAVISALDGVLAAEREAGVQAGRVKLSVTWSFAMMSSIDGKEDGPGVFGFQDTVAVIANPSIAKYTPRSSHAQLEHAFKTRWVHGVNTQSPWIFIKEKIFDNYARFSPIPWFIGEYGANGQFAATIQGDLEDMQRTAERSSDFLGTTFFQFQTAYWKTAKTDLNFGQNGIFSLGAKTLADVTPTCRFRQCPSWPVHCLSTGLPWLHGTKGNRAEAVAAAWRGSLQKVENGPGFCGGRRLSAEEEQGTRIACQIRASAGLSASEVSRRLQEDAFSVNLVKSTKKALGNNADAILGDLSVDNAMITTPEKDGAAEAQTRGSGSSFKKWIPQIVAVALLAVACGLAFWGFVAHRNRKARQCAPNGSERV